MLTMLPAAAVSAAVTDSRYIESRATAPALAMPATRDFFRQGAYEAESSSPQALAALTHATYDEWGDIILKLGLAKQAQ